MDMDNFFGETLLRIVIIIAAAALVQVVSRGIIERITRRLIRPSKDETKEDEKKREDTLITILGTVFNVLLWAVAFVTILGELNVNIPALLTGAGVIGVVVGLGAQSTIKDYIAGIYILAENQYRVGDIITLSGGPTGLGTSGVVEDVTLRITQLRDLEGTLNTVRNGEASIVTNRTFKYSSVVIRLNVAYNSNIDRVEKVMNDVGLEIAGDEAWKSLTTEPIQFKRVDAFTESSMTVLAVGKVHPASQWDVAGDYRRRLVKALKKEGVEIGYPQVVLHSSGAPGKKAL